MSNYNDEITISIKGDISEISDDLNQVEHRVKNLKSHGLSIEKDDLKTITGYIQELQEVTNPEKMPQLYGDMLSSLTNSLRQQVKSFKAEIYSQLKDLNVGEMISADISAGLKKSFAYLQTQLKTITPALSAIRSIYKDVQDKDSFSKDLNDMMRRAHSIMSSTQQSMSENEWMKTLNRAVGYQSGSNEIAKRYQLSQNQINALTKSFVRMAPVVRNRDFLDQLTQASNGQIQKTLNPINYSSYRERLPDFYKKIADTPTLSTQKEINAISGRLTSGQYALVKYLAEQNATFERALVSQGLARRTSVDGKAGTLQMSETPISRRSLAKAIGSLHRDYFIPALEGDPGHHIPIGTVDARDAQRLALRNSKDVSNAYAAFDALAPLGIQPLYVENKKPSFRAKDFVNLDSATRIRPERYQIMSLTLDDFKKGVVLDPTKDVQSEFEERARGVSVNKMIQSSIYTRLAGLFGDRTLGNGQKTDYGTPKIIQIDMTNDLLAKNKNGKIVYEKGVPVENEETQKIIAQMLSPTQTITGKRLNGEPYSYNYPVMMRGEGDNQLRYVPTNAKGGVITAMLENDFLRITRKSIEETGANVLDNYVKADTSYETLEKLNKQLEARNRLLTPNTPIEQLGGNIPSPSKIAFVDLKSFTGHDGSSFFMPGYIPGDNATFRVGGFKGLAQTVDYKTMIRDLYGDDVSSFYLPALNAPKDIKDRFNNQGIGGFNQKELDRYFYNIMNYDALISDSVVKTPILQDESLTKRQLANTWKGLIDQTGFGIVATAQDFLSKQDSLGTQLSQMLNLTPEQAEENNKKWNDYISRLSNDTQFAINTLFSDETDPLSQRVREDNSLLWTDRLAADRLLTKIEQARIAQLSGELYGRDELVLGLAGANPAEQILKLGKLQNLSVKNQDLANVLALSDNTISFGQLNKDQNVGGSRWPGSWSQQYALNLSKEYADAVRKYGMSPDVIYTNTGTIAKMGGGDVDGDTVQLMRGALYNIVANTVASGNFNDQGRDLTPSPIAIDRPYQPSDFASLLYRQLASSMVLGAVSNASDALMQGNWEDDLWRKHTGSGYEALKQLYDIDSTFMKTGTLGAWTAEAVRARQMGKPFSHVFKHLIGAATEGNFDQFADLSQINFPSRFHMLTANTLAGLANNPFDSASVQDLIAAQEAIQGIQGLLDNGDDLSLAKADYLKYNNRLMSMFASGRASYVAQSDKEELVSRLEHWRNIVHRSKDIPGLTPERKEQLDQELGEIWKQRQRLQNLELFGAYGPALTSGSGYADILLRGRSTADSSAFDLAYENATEEERKRIREANIKAAIASGVDPFTLQQGMAQQESKLRAERAAKWYSFPVSWSQMRTLQTNPEEWYKQYYLGQRSSNIHAEFGNIADALVTDWMKQRMALQEGKTVDEQGNEILLQSNPEKWKEQMKARFNAMFESKDAKKWFPSITDLQSYTGNVPKSIVEKYSQVLSLIDQMPGLFPNETILGAQTTVRPDWGNRADDPNKKLATTGKLDIKSMDADGNIIITDFKPRSNYASGQRQITSAYADPTTKKWRLLGYDGKTKEGEITPDEYKKAQEEMTNLAGIAQQIVLGTIPYDQIRTNIARAGLLRDPKSDLPITPQQYLQTLTGSSGAVDVAKQMATDKFDRVTEEDIEKKDEETLKQIRESHIAAMNKNTGEAIAKSIALENEIAGTANEYDELAGKLSSIKRRKERNGLANQWEGMKAQIDSFEAKYSDYQNRGASDEQLNRLSEAHDQAKDNFDQALMVSSYLDQEEQIQKINEAMNKQTTSSTALGYIKSFDSLAESIEKASQAYQLFKKEMDDKDDKSKEEIDALAKAERDNIELMKTADQYRDTMRQEASSTLTKTVEDLEAKASGTPLSPEQQVSRAKENFALEIAKQINGITQLKQKGILDETIAEALTQRLSSIDTEAYAKLVSDDLEQSLRHQQESARHQTAMGDIAILQSENNLAATRRRLQQQHMMRNPMRDHSRFEQGYFGLLNQRDQNLSTVEAMNLAIAREEENIRSLEASKGDKGANVDAINKQIEAAQNNLTGYRETLRSAEEALDSFASKHPAAATAINMVTEATSKLVSRLGRQAFQKAVREATQFVQQFDASMTNIQAITMKSTDQMSRIREQTIEKAIQLRTGVQDVASVETDLYRQGLSDSEVSERTDSILKFAKVSGVKVQDATKIITTALQNGLVASATEAMDALTALGDSAATTAGDIGKAMQKCAAAAKVAKVSYGELTSMITIMTSSTQLSGTQVGTALNSIISRMRKLNTTGYAGDINGDNISRNDVEEALKLAGIQLIDDQSQEFRPVSEVLLDISKRWNDMSDIQRANISTAIAGTRAGNMFQTLMEGMSEDNGAEYERLLKTAEGSAGITDEKYEVQTKSLTASIEELRATFDGLVNDVTGGAGVFSSVIDIVTQIISGIREMSGVLQAVIPIVGAVTLAFAALHSTTVGIAAIAALVTGAFGLIGNIAKSMKQPTEEELGLQDLETSNQYIEQRKKTLEDNRKLIEETRKLGQQYKEVGIQMDAASQSKLEGNLNKLIALFPQLGGAIQDTTDILREWEAIVNGADKAMGNMTNETISTARRLSSAAGRKLFNQELDEALNEYDEAVGIKSFETMQNAIAMSTQIVADRFADSTETESEWITRHGKAVAPYSRYLLDRGGVGSMSEIQLSMRDAVLKNIDQENMTPEQSALLNAIHDGVLTEEQMQAFSNLTNTTPLTGYRIDSSQKRAYYDLFSKEGLMMLFNGGYEDWKDVLTIDGQQLDISELRANITPILSWLYQAGSFDQFLGQEGFENEDAFLQMMFGGYYNEDSKNVFDNVFSILMNSIGANGQNLPAIFNDITKGRQNVFAQAVKDYHDKYVGESSFYDDTNGVLSTAALNYVLDRAYNAKDANNNYIHRDSSGNLVYDKSWVKASTLSEWFSQAYTDLSIGGRQQHLARYNPDALQYYSQSDFDKFNKRIADQYGAPLTGVSQSALDSAEAAIRFAARERGEDQDEIETLVANFKADVAKGIAEFAYESLEDARAAILEQLKKEGLSGDALDEALRAKMWDVTDDTVSSIVENAYLQTDEYVNRDRKATAGRLLSLFGVGKYGSFQDFKQAVQGEFEPTEVQGSVIPVLNQAGLLPIWYSMQNNPNSPFTMDNIQTALSAYYSGNASNMVDANIGTLSTFFGTDNLVDSLLNGTFTLDEGLGKAYEGDMGIQAFFSDMIQKYPELQAALTAISEGTQMTTEQMRNLGAALESARIADKTEELGETAEEAAKRYKQLHGSAADVASAYRDMNSAMTRISNNKYYRDLYKSGNRDKETLQSIASQTKMTEEMLKTEMGQKMAESLFATFDAEDIEEAQTWADAVYDTSVEALEKRFNQDTNKIVLDNGFEIDIEKGEANVNMDDAINEVSGYLSEAQAEMLKMLQEWGAKAHVEIIQDGKTFSARIVVDQISGKNTGGGGKGGGGGGGKKSAADKLMDEIKKEQEIVDHRIKMIRYQETLYENDGQLTNVNALLEQENKLQYESIYTNTQAIERMKKQLAAVKQGSDDWYKLRDAILSAEEAIQEANNTIWENIRKIEQNRQKIKKLYADMENAVVQEIENRIQKEKDMLAATVDMQNIILDAIKQRYQDAWDLQKKDIEKKKQALEEEKALIDERLQRRKEAEDEALQYEELAELRRQYAMISMDTTRTKDAAALREKIEKLERDLAWGLAEDEAESQKQNIADQITAYDQLVSVGDEDLDQMLSNANNFSEEVNQVLAMNQEDLMIWLKQNVQEYANSLEDAQLQMVQSWEDTYNQMMGITKTYWDEVAAILSSQASFVAFMQQSDEYINASPTQQAILDYQWMTEMWNAWALAIQDNHLQFDHTDDFAGIGLPAGSSGGGSGGGKKPTATQPAVQPATPTTSSISAAVSNVLNVIPSILQGGSSLISQIMHRSSDMFNFRPTISNIDSEKYTAGRMLSLENLTVNINEATLSQDADYEEVAARVGQALVKELAKEGLTTANYSL